MCQTTPRYAPRVLNVVTTAVVGIFVVCLGSNVRGADSPEGLPAAEATPDVDAGRNRSLIYRFDPVDEKLYLVAAEDFRAGHVYNRFDTNLGRWVWSKADEAGDLCYVMGVGSTQPVRMFDLQKSDEERQRALERRAPELARLMIIQGARPMLRLDALGQWGLGPTPCVSSVFDLATSQRWEWHGDTPSRVVHAGGNRWVFANGWYEPSF
jgi:hypothetical protein